jgi:Putative zinc-finger
MLPAVLGRQCIRILGDQRMTHNHRSGDVREHQEISELIPWYLNGSIGDYERQRVEAHVQLCALCRDDLAQERRIYQGMTAETAVEYMPAASLKRLQARLDGVDAAADADIPAQVPAVQKWGRRAMTWQGLMAASVAVMAVAISLLAADRWVQFRARVSAPNYYTVTNPATRAPNEVIRAVFSPTITLVELQSVLDEAQLRIIAGPTEAGVYSLAANSRRPVSSSLALLRAHAKVRFAESTQPSMGSGDTP